MAGADGVTVFICTSCGAKDSHRGPTPAPIALNCWKCGAGKGKDLQAMQGTGEGMFPEHMIEAFQVEREQERRAR